MRGLVARMQVGLTPAVRLGMRHLYLVALELVPMTPMSPKPLREVADPLGYGIADVAYLSGLEESTVSRLWDDPDWLEKIRGKSLQALIAVIPGVADLIINHPLAMRRERLYRELFRQGVEPNTAAITDLISMGLTSEQIIGTALETGLHILREDDQKSARHLSRFWLRDHNYVLTLLFQNQGSGGLLRDNKPLIQASKVMAGRLVRYTRSFHSFMGYATLVHHVAKATGQVIDVAPSGGDRQNAFTARSTTMGLILSNDDLDAAERYEYKVAHEPLAKIIEDWAFPTYMRDAPPTNDFTLPRSLSLRQTAVQVIKEIESYNEAYLYYLSKVYIPRALERDPKFGERRSELASALERRLESCSQPKVRAALENLRRQLT
jgi:hypothetical protein